MSIDRVIAGFLRLAHEDLDGAAQLATAGNRNAVYLCEQAAEKIIRAVLTAEGTHAGPKHDLDQMVSLLPDENPMKPTLGALGELSAYATTYRYPTPSGRLKDAPSATTMSAYLEKTRSALVTAARAFGVDLSDPNRGASNTKPLR